MSDPSRYLILYRNKEDPDEKQWDLQCIVLSLEHGFQSAHETYRQERYILGHKKFEICIVSETEYDEGKFKPISLPKGWTPTPPILCPVCIQKPVSVPAAQLSRPGKSEPEPKKAPVKQTKPIPKAEETFD